MLHTPQCYVSEKINNAVQDKAKPVGPCLFIVEP